MGPDADSGGGGDLLEHGVLFIPRSELHALLTFEGIHQCLLRRSMA